MTSPADPGTAFAALLADPGTRVAAIGLDGFRVEVPAGLGLPPGQVLPLPQERTTMLDLVVPSEAMHVIHAWEEVRAEGSSQAEVHLRVAPQVDVVLTFVDARAAHGVHLALLSPARGTGQHVVADTTPVPELRPRTCTMRKTYNAVILGVDERAERMLDLAAEQFVGVRSTELIHPDDHERALAAWMDMLSRRAGSRVRVRHRRGSDGWVWVELENSLVTGADGSPEVVTEVLDVSDEMEAHERVARQERFFRRLAEVVPLGLVQLDAAGTTRFANGQAERLLGADGTSLEALLREVARADAPVLRHALASVLQQGRQEHLEVGLRRQGTGEPWRCAVTLVPGSDQGAGAMLCLEDVTERVQAAAELSHRASHDALTGCLNRAAVTGVLEEALAGGVGVTGLVFVDLDEFKAVNDTYGHAAGDELLVWAAGALRASVRPTDAVGRLGGDEFVVVLRGAGDAERVRVVGERIEEALSSVVRLVGADVPVGASIGAAASLPGEDAVSLTARADEAMYANKRRRAELRGRSGARSGARSGTRSGGRTGPHA